jgi:hypothetical protein
MPKTVTTRKKTREKVRRAQGHRVAVQLQLCSKRKATTVTTGSLDKTIGLRPDGTTAYLMAKATMTMMTTTTTMATTKEAKTTMKDEPDTGS